MLGLEIVIGFALVLYLVKFIADRVNGRGREAKNSEPYPGPPVKDFTALACRTTGVNPYYDKITSLGAVRFRDGRPAESIEISPFEKEKLLRFLGTDNVLIAFDAVFLEPNLGLEDIVFIDLKDMASRLYGDRVHSVSSLVKKLGMEKKITGRTIAEAGDIGESFLLLCREAWKAGIKLGL